jgi:glycosyltransferase involved in cell wall biosynthesis
MKILYVITKSNWGGAQRHVFDLSTSMKAKGHEVWVALGGEGLLKTKLEQAGIYTFSIAQMGRDVDLGKDAGSFKEIYNVIKNKRPDIIHLHSPKATGLGSLAGRLLRTKKIITTVHGWTFNESRPFHEKISIGFFSWLTMLFSHLTIVLSDKEFKQALLFPGVKNKIRLVPLGIKPITFVSVDGAKQALAKAIGMDFVDFYKKNIVATIAELHPNKGLPYLIEAMKTVVTQQTNTICLIIGDGQDKDSLTELIKSNNLSDKVFLTGRVDNASDYLKAITVFVLPSLKEGLPYTILESGMASLATVATTVGGIPEIVEDMKSGILIQPRNSKELAHAISFMIEHPEERKRYGNALKERVNEKYSFGRMIDENEGLYR